MYYIRYGNDGKPFYKGEADTPFYGGNIVEVTAEEYEAFDVDKQREIFDLKKKLADTDYIACKIAEGAATVEEYAEQIAERQTWRERINELANA